MEPIGIHLLRTGRRSTRSAQLWAAIEPARLLYITAATCASGLTQAVTLRDRGTDALIPGRLADQRRYWHLVAVGVAGLTDWSGSGSRAGDARLAWRATAWATFYAW